MIGEFFEQFLVWVRRFSACKQHIEYVVIFHYRHWWSECSTHTRLRDGSYKGLWNVRRRCSRGMGAFGRIRNIKRDDDEEAGIPMLVDYYRRWRTNA